MREIFRAALRKLESLPCELFPGHHKAIEGNPRIRFFAYFVMVLASVLFGISVLNLLSDNPLRSLTAALAGAGQIVGLLVLRFVANPKIAFRISGLAILGYFLFLMDIGGPQGARVFWMLVFPVYALLLFGGGEGLLWATTGFIGSLLVLSDANDIFATFSAENNRFLLTYVILGLLAVAFEGIGYRTQEGLFKERNEPA